MKGYFVGFFLLSSSIISAQSNKKVLFVEENNFYSLLIEPTTQILKKDIADSHIETFVFSQNSQFKYTLTVSTSKAINMTNDSLFAPHYQLTYMNNCGCEIINVKLSKINDVNSLEFKILRIDKGRKMLGYTTSCVINSILFNVVFLTLEDRLSSFEPEYQVIMQDFKINKDATY
jgi:hypothetical protein